MAEPPAPSGLFYITSSADESKGLTPDAFTKWYNDIHIPELLALPGLDSAFRYSNTAPDTKPQYLCLYPLASLDTLKSAELAKVDNVHEATFPGPSHDVRDFADLKARVYVHVQSYEPVKKSGPGNFLVAVAVTPALGTDADFDAWYRTEHLADIAACPGYMRTRRFKAVPAPQTEPDVPAYIALHEFEGETLPMEQLKKTTDTEWAKRMQEGALKKETGVWKLIRGFGELDVNFYE